MAIAAAQAVGDSQGGIAFGAALLVVASIAAKNVELRNGTANFSSAAEAKPAHPTRTNATVRVFTTHSAADLDPIVTLALILVEARPDRMGVLGEFTGG